MKFSNQLIYWYLQNDRDLLWRKTKNPYHIWLSEIILQQTRVNQGLSYYVSFVKAFPTVVDLANASESKVLKLWQGLGYYSRARNLHYSAKYIVNELNGVFPTTYEEIKKLKGVGDYTASAIASICFNEPHAVVDGNVYRVLARYFGVSTPINSTKGIKEFKELAQTLIDASQPGTFNQAIMDFGALHCKPQQPLCKSCPFNTSCVALKNQSIKELPVKEKKTKIKQRYFNFLVVLNAEHETVFTERKGKGIWQGLYQFPLVETQKSITKEELMSNSELEKWISTIDEIFLFNEKEIVHKLSHQHLYTKFWILKANNIKSPTISWSMLKKYPVPILIANFLKKFNPINGYF
ncbi:MAG: A/G-specific adenine glycosylase [Flavobacteriaceae bacterium]|nr:A/G-specific adenine glycosylase [Flavobacteriaceae bacterium]